MNILILSPCKPNNGYIILVIMELFFIADFSQSHISYPRLIIRHPHNLNETYEYETEK